jgi:hypothetical protein
MKDPRTAQVIELKRQLPMWSVKVGERYVTGFMGNNARARATRFATENYASIEIVERSARRQPSRKRKEGASQKD